MRFLLVSLYHEGSLSWYCDRALKILGNDVYVFYPWKNADLRFRLKDRIGLHYNSEESYFSIGKALIRKVKKCKPDVVFVIKGIEILPETLTELKRESGCILINWWPDDPHLNEVSRKLSPFYDLFFTHDQGSVPLYLQHGAKNVSCLNFGCDPEIHRDLSQGERKYFYDLSFIGGWNEEREKSLEPFTKFKISIWGPGWEKVQKGSPLNNSLKGGQVLGLKMTEIYNRSKIVLNIHTTQGCLRGGVNMRTFEIPACRTLQLVDKTKEVIDLFQMNEEVVCFENLKEAFDQIEYYLIREREREIIALRGQKRAHSCHSYKLRMEHLISIIRNS
jgi:spore maturation protein CgeB